MLTGNLYLRTIFSIKSTEDLKSKYKPGSDYYLGQTLSRLDARREIFTIKNPPLATLASDS